MTISQSTMTLRNEGFLAWAKACCEPFAQQPSRILFPAPSKVLPANDISDQITNILTAMAMGFTEGALKSDGIK